MTGWLRDLPWILRNWRRRPAFAAAAALTFTLGIGAAGAVFSLLDALLLSPLPYPDGRRLVRITSSLQRDAAAEEVPCSFLDFADWRDRQEAVVDLVARTGARSFNLFTAGEAEHVEGEMATAGYFRLVGMEPVLGRTFTSAEQHPASGARVVVLSHALWQRRFGGDDGVLGRHLDLNGERHRVVGVGPPGFQGLSQRAELFLPLSAARYLLAPYYLDSRAFRWLSVVGRLGDGVELPHARQELSAVASALARDEPETNETFGILVEPLSEELLGSYELPLLVLQAAAILVLLVAATNVSALLLARGRNRAGETALRAALGEPPRDSSRRVVTESVLLALAGAVVALPMVFLAPRVLLAVGAVELPTFIRLRPGPGVAAALVAAALVCGAVFGFPAALAAARHSAAATQHPGGAGTGGRRRNPWSSIQVAIQVALTVVLLFGCGFLLEDLDRRLARELGFDPHGLLTLRLDLKGPRYAEDAAMWSLATRLVDEASALPGVEAVALAGPGIPTDDWNGTFATLEHPLADEVEDLLVLQHFVTPAYFSTLRVPLLRGRGFEPRDRDGSSRTVVVSEALAQRFWPGREALGERLKLGPLWLDPPWLTVVGVVSDVAHEGPAGEPRPASDLYLPFFQSPPRSPPIVNLLVRSSPATVPNLVESLRQRAKRLDATLPVYDIATLEERIGRQMVHLRFVLLLLGLFALFTLGLAIVGVYGTVTGDVAQRRGEIAVRRVMGAQRHDIAALVLRTTATAVMAGILVGTAAGFLWLPALLRGLLPAMASEAAPARWSIALSLLASTALVSAVFPVLRALAVDPVLLLREPEA